MSCNQYTDDVLLDWVQDDVASQDRDALEKHLQQCSHCSARVASLRTLLLVETQATADAHVDSHVDLQALLPLLRQQSQSQRSVWATLRRHPSLAAAAAALLALFFSAGYVQGNLSGRRATEDPAPREAAAASLPAPPELGLLAVQTASTWSSWESPSYDSLPNIVPRRDSL